MSKNSNRVKQPVTKGTAKVPVIMQMEALECGAAALTMILAYYNKWVPLEQVRKDCDVSRDGSNARNMAVAARNYGLKAAAYRCDPEVLRQEGTFPCILHWDFNHFVVLNGFKGRYAYINDPARGFLKITREEFNSSFTGVCLVFEPGENFEPGGKKKNTIAFARSRLRGAKAAVVFVMLTTLIGALFGIINPVMKKVFMDRLLTGENPQWLNSFIILLIALALLEIAVMWANAIYSLKLNGKMAAIGSTSYMWKVLSLPMDFFSQRMAGDILERRSTNLSIASTLVNTFAPLLMNTAMMVLYFILMIRQSLILTAIGLGVILINCYMSHIISKKRVNITRVMQRDSAKLAATRVSGIELIETIKASGAEKGFFRKWSGYQASVNAQSVKIPNQNTILGLLPSFLAMLADSAVMVVGVWLVMDGEFTLGALTMFQGFLGEFMSPAMTMINAGQVIQEMRTDMERVEDVMQYPSDPNVIRPEKKEGRMRKLRGNVELKDITFGYSSLDEPLIRGFSMDIKRGTRVAFVGASGCGKSTLSKLITGLYEPWEGEILFDGKNREEYDRSVMSGSIAVVDQDITLFEGTIADNIKMWDESILDYEVILAAKDAQIHEDIMDRDGGYDCKITAEGRDLSGGQKQRLEIARVLAQDPSIIILDEATSALDAATEKEVVEAIKGRGLTCIVIAHRLSTIRDCDEIVVLDKGQAVERGTHDELMELGGAYAELVTND